MRHKLLFIRIVLAVGILLSVFGNKPLVSVSAQMQLPGVGAKTSFAVSLYDPGTPAFTDIWVDLVSGNDSNPGTFASPFQTLTHAWATIPTTNPLTQGVRINLQPGIYTAIPPYWETRYGTFAVPIMIRGNGAARGDVILQETVNMYDVHYVY